MPRAWDADLVLRRTDYMYTAGVMQIICVPAPDAGAKREGSEKRSAAGGNFCLTPGKQAHEGGGVCCVDQRQCSGWRWR